MDRRRPNRKLIYATAFYFMASISVVVYEQIGGDTTYPLPPGGADVEVRNESSTPRSFVLPATPAIALEQEAAHSEAARRRGSCARRLSSMGYRIGLDDAGKRNAQLIVAIFSYQKDHNLEASGRLDRATMQALGCDES